MNTPVTTKTVAGHEITSYSVKRHPIETPYHDFDEPCFGSEYFVNVIILKDRKLRVYTKNAPICHLVARDSIVADCVAYAKSLPAPTNRNDKYGVVNGLRVIINGIVGVIE